MKVMVTGAGGFLGSHICQYFGERGHPVAAVGRFAADIPVVKSYPRLELLAGMTLPDPAFVRAVTTFRPDLVVHAAASAKVADSVARPYFDFQQSVDVCAFVLDTLRQHVPETTFVLLSSAAVYGNPMALPIREGMPCAPVSPYGYHKWLCELVVEEYRALFGLRTSVLRIFSAYGERLRRQVVHDLCRQALEGEGPVRVFGTGSESRDFVHARDVAQAIECVAHAPSGSPSVFNVASGSETRIDALVRTLLDVLGCTRSVTFTGESLPGYPTNWRADVSRLASLGFQPGVTLDDGLTRYARWLEACQRSEA
ncbi:MAG: NAD-dependent epimerase/dehydratase family protein [Deltaproteobacteria bacterium]|nr:NAD-dependent epimerase/dehydratase family protein [Deltaproteobacteria bacterium]